MEFGLDLTEDDASEVPAAQGGGAQGVTASIELRPRRQKRPLWMRILLGIGATVLALLATAALLYLFGGMERPSAETRATYDRLHADGRAAPLERRFVIPIPGCKCHSDDPVLTMEHSVRRIRDCSGCHAR